jgi:hypothetical protein
MPPIYTDNFESYTVGQATPFGEFGDGGAHIAAGNYPSRPGSQCIYILPAFYPAATWANGTLYSSGSTYLAFTYTAQSNGAFVGFFNGDPNLLGLQSIVNLAFEVDNTISAYCDGAFAANSGDVSVKFNQWYFLQVNVTLSSVLVGGTFCIKVAFTVWLEGTQILSGAVQTAIATSTVPSATAQFDHIHLTNNLLVDEFTFDVLSGSPAYPNAGTPNVRPSTGLAEVLELPTTASTRMTTGLVELIEAITSAKIRVSTGLIEIIISQGVAPAGWIPQFKRRVNSN